MYIHVYNYFKLLKYVVNGLYSTSLILLGWFIQFATILPKAYKVLAKTSHMGSKLYHTIWY